MAKISQEELFTKVCDHMMEQGAPALVEGACSYRGNNGTSCAVGCLITDEEYHSDMEGNDVDSLIFDGLLPSRLHEHKRLLDRLQSCHDAAQYLTPEEVVPEWKARLRLIANEFGIKTPTSILV